MRKLTYLIAQTIDGYIAGPDNDDPSPWFVLEGDHADPLREEFPDTYPTHVRSMLGMESTPNRHFDTVLQGRCMARLLLTAVRPGLSLVPDDSLPDLSGRDRVVLPVSLSAL